MQSLDDAGAVRSDKELLGAALNTKEEGDQERSIAQLRVSP
jgi:hypothetical protein